MGLFNRKYLIVGPKKKNHHHSHQVITTTTNDSNTKIIETITSKHDKVVFENSEKCDNEIHCIKKSNKPISINNNNNETIETIDYYCNKCGNHFTIFSNFCLKEFDNNYCTKNKNHDGDHVIIK
jgi:hypothetical protein